jgi:hypothetical protein
MKRLKMLGVAVLAITALSAVMVSNAFAVDAPEGKTVTIVTNTGALTATSTALTLTVGTKSLVCKNVITANVEESGTVTVSADVISPGSAECNLVEAEFPENGKWDGKICKVESEYWLFIKPTFTSPLGNFSGWTKTTLNTTAVTHEGKAGYVSANSITLTKSQVGTSTAFLDGTFTLNHSPVGIVTETNC